MTAPAARVGALRSPHAAAALAALVVLAVSLASITPEPIGVFVDDGIYVMVAHALAAGQGLRYTFLPGMPAAIHYPPLFPAVLAVVMRWSPPLPENVALLKMVNPCFAAVGAGGAVVLGTRVLALRPWIAAVAVSVAALIAPVLMLSNVLMSEPMFFAVLVWALVAVETAGSRGGMRWALVAGVACAAVVLVRTIGIVVIPAAVSALWMNRRRREALMLAAAAVIALAPWQLFVRSASGAFPRELGGMYGPYLEWLAAAYRSDPMLAWHVLVVNTAAVWRMLGPFFAPRLPHLVQAAAAAVVVAGVAAGVMAMRRRALSVALFVALYSAIVLMWPYAPARFVAAVWPLVVLILVAAAQAARARWAGANPHRAQLIMAAAALLLAGHAVYAARGLQRGWASAAQRERARLLWPQVQWAAANVGPRELLASDAHVMIALYTGLTTIPVAMLTPQEYLAPKPPRTIAAELDALFSRYRPTRLLLAPGAPELDALPHLAGLPGGSALVPSTPVEGIGGIYLLSAQRP